MRVCLSLLAVNVLLAGSALADLADQCCPKEITGIYVNGPPYRGQYGLVPSTAEGDYKSGFVPGWALNCLYVLCDELSSALRCLLHSYKVTSPDELQSVAQCLYSTNDSNPDRPRIGAGGMINESDCPTHL
jgi:hypothetical protein